METPVFEEIEPASDCDCAGCRHWRRVLPHAPAGRALARTRTGTADSSKVNVAPSGLAKTVVRSVRCPGTSTRSPDSRA
ncbi:peptidoglycan-binding protein, partial [Streptomyces sp. LRa12]